MERPRVDIFQGHDPRLPPADVNVVIDVLRAFTTTHVAFEKGVEQIVLVDTVDAARNVAERYADCIAAGERDALRVDGFDFGNSPCELEEAELSADTMVFTTSNGVRATLNALDADEVIVTGFTNAHATALYLRLRAQDGDIERINLVASHPTSQEDVVCAEWLRDRVLGTNEISDDVAVSRMRAAESAQKFFDESSPFDPCDVELAMTPRASNFVMVVRAGDDEPRIVALPVGQSG